MQSGRTLNTARALAVSGTVTLKCLQPSGCIHCFFPSLPPCKNVINTSDHTETKTKTYLIQFELKYCFFAYPNFFDGRQTCKLLNRILGCGCLHAYPRNLVQRLDQEACLILAKHKAEKRLEHLSECAKGSVHNPEHPEDSIPLQNIVLNSPALYSSSASISELMVSSFLKSFKQE